MKKIYIRPNLQVIRIDAETVVAGSFPPIQDEVGNGQQFVRPRNYEDDDSEDD